MGPFKWALVGIISGILGRFSTEGVKGGGNRHLERVLGHRLGLLGSTQNFWGRENSPSGYKQGFKTPLKGFSLNMGTPTGRKEGFGDPLYFSFWGETLLYGLRRPKRRGKYLGGCGGDPFKKILPL